MPSNGNLVNRTPKRQILKRFLSPAMNQTQFKVADSKREEFRKYLEKAGVLDAITKVLVSLYEEPEKPSNALDYLSNFLHGGPPQTGDVEELKLNLEQVKEANALLVKENEELKQKLQQYEHLGEEKEVPQMETS